MAGVFQAGSPFGSYLTRSESAVFTRCGTAFGAGPISALDKQGGRPRSYPGWSARPRQAQGGGAVRVTIGEVALHAGVSKTTVSRVLNSRGEVDEKTARRGQGRHRPARLRAERTCCRACHWQNEHGRNVGAVARVALDQPDCAGCRRDLGGPQVRVARFSP
jgi:hypothetical protein